MANKITHPPPSTVEREVADLLEHLFGTHHADGAAPYLNGAVTQAEADRFRLLARSIRERRTRIVGPL